MIWTLDPSADVSLSRQLAGCVRRALADGTLEVGDRLPPAVELASGVGVDRNTVLAAYRSLRDEGILEFRRGRGVRVASGAPESAPLDEAIDGLVAAARRNGYTTADLIRLIEEKA